MKMEFKDLLYQALIVVVCCSFHPSAVPLKSTSQNSTSHEIYSTTFNNVEEAEIEFEAFTVDEEEYVIDRLGEGKILFEGDIEISIEELRRYYDISATIEKELMSGQLSKRAVTSNEEILWKDCTIPYNISSCFDDIDKQHISNAMSAWSSFTCLNFVERSSQVDYVYFTNSNGTCSSRVGRGGGLQYIRLADYCLQSRGMIMHMIGHALGLFHEHARPDRDNYVTVNYHNIDPSKRRHFEKKLEKEVDYQGTEYDYGSIMHYAQRAWVTENCIGCLALDVNNNIAYNMQGQPTIGQRTQISPTDITQVNRLYKCPNPGQKGFLRLYIRYGSNLEVTDTLGFGDPDPYVRVKAISSTSCEDTKETTHKKNTRNPTWKEELLFRGTEWQFFRLSVWDSDVGDDDSMGMSVTVPLLNQPSNSSCQIYCTNTDCDRNITYDYELLPMLCGCLRVYIRYAEDLPDTDPIWNDPDPYVRVEVTGCDLSVLSQQTSAIQGTTDPAWYTWLKLSGCTFMDHIYVHVLDDDVFFDDEISSPEAFAISPGLQSSIRHCVTTSCSSVLYFDIEFTPDGDECSPNPCENSGTCIDGCASYSCICPSLYVGDWCQCRERRLTICVLYGRDLPDEDSFVAGDSDPYVKITAYDIFGNLSIQETSTVQGDEDPEWNECFDFGIRCWRRFEMSVWDEDVHFDDRLSSTHTWHLPYTSFVLRTRARLNAYEGYVVFDYSYI
jgi:astacin